MNNITAAPEEERREREHHARAVAAILAGNDEAPAATPSVGDLVELAALAAVYRDAMCEMNDEVRRIEGEVAHRLLKEAEPTDTKNVAAVVEAFDRFMDTLEATVAFRDDLVRRRLPISGLPGIMRLFSAVGHRGNAHSVASFFLGDPQIAPLRRGQRRAS